MIKTIWFDIGGTIHTQEATHENDMAYVEKLTELLQSFGISELPDAQLLIKSLDAGAKRYKKYSEETLTELPGDEIWIDYMFSDYPHWHQRLIGHGEALSYLFDRYRKVITPRPHVRETLIALKADGYRLGVISNIMSHTFVPSILDEYGIRTFFDELILSSECGIRKADPRIFEIALERVGGKPEEACYIGDTVSRDVLGTRNAGWALMIQIDNPLTYRKDTAYLDKGFKPDYKIHDFNEIQSALTDYMRRE
ncbi:MAG: HAD family hydrolase [Lachnospiraceae bacterium]|nr:HAD family hydrolase [Lachnospiraceae bacterium]